MGDSGGARPHHPIPADGMVDGSAGARAAVSGGSRRRRRSCRPEAVPRDRAHPRRCGEHPPSRTDSNQIGGSSPQVRGTSRRPLRRLGRRRLIPAGAGNITAAQRFLLWPWAHPRRCGEHAADALSMPTCTGSSPQVRGTWNIRHDHEPGPRLIPAGAGNIMAPCRTARHSGAHPRRCGEHGRVGGPVPLGRTVTPLGNCVVDESGELEPQRQPHGSARLVAGCECAWYSPMYL